MTGPTDELEAPRFVRRQSWTAAGFGRTIRFDNLSDIHTQWEKFAPHIGHIAGQVGEAVYAIMRDAPGGFDYFTAVEVAGDGSLPEGFTRLTMPAGTYAVLVHKGGTDTLKQSFAALMGDWLPNSGRKAAKGWNILERYGPGFDPEAGKGDIEIWVVLQD